MLEIDKIVSQYRKKSTWLIIGISLVALLVAQILAKSSFYQFVIFNALFTLFLSGLYIRVWKLVARYSPQYIGKFYLGASAVRFILTLVVAIIGVLLFSRGRYERMSFLLILSAYYFFILFFDTAFFYQCEKEGKLNNNKE